MKVNLFVFGVSAIVGFTAFYILDSKIAHHALPPGAGFSPTGDKGWYTILGHHGPCHAGTQGCVCTDPPNCIKPPTRPGTCRPDLQNYGNTDMRQCDAWPGTKGCGPGSAHLSPTINVCGPGQPCPCRDGPGGIPINTPDPNVTFPYP